MDWQEIISLIIVGLSVSLIVRSEIRKYKLRKTRFCGGDCNCAATKFTHLKQHQTKQVYPHI